MSKSRDTRNQADLEWEKWMIQLITPYERDRNLKEKQESRLREINRDLAMINFRRYQLVGGEVECK